MSFCSESQYGTCQGRYFRHNHPKNGRAADRHAISNIVEQWLDGQTERSNVPDRPFSAQALPSTLTNFYD